MLDRKLKSLAVASTFALMLCSCGGGGGGGGNSANFAPAPPPTPPPPEPAPFGVTADTTFETVGDGINIRWDQDAGVYELQMPGAAWDALQRASAGVGASTYRPASGSYLLQIFSNSPSFPYSYTNLAAVTQNGSGISIGNFAYGLATTAQNMPVVGNATYYARLYGAPAQGLGVIRGTASLNFDFAAGTVGGHLDPVLEDPTGLGFESAPLDRYIFVNTVYSTGSTSFSGNLSTPSVAGLGSFSGIFTGPSAQELMADWSAPMINPIGGLPDTMSGVLIGKQ